MTHKELLGLMGKLVAVSEVLVRQKSGNLCTWVTRDREPRIGWVVGIRWLNVGERIPSSGNSTNYLGESDYEPPSFNLHKKIKVLAISFWPTEKPVFVPIEKGWIGLLDKMRNLKSLPTEFPTPLMVTGMQGHCK